MLAAIPKTPGTNRRWFNDDDFDLIVRHNGGTITGFQLCYDRNGNEHALTWMEGKGAGHHRIDSGENSPLKNRAPVPALTASSCHMLS